MFSDTTIRRWAVRIGRSFACSLEYYSVNPNYFANGYCNEHCLGYCKSIFVLLNCTRKLKDGTLAHSTQHRGFPRLIRLRTLRGIVYGVNSVHSVRYNRKLFKTSVYNELSFRFVFTSGGISTRFIRLRRRHLITTIEMGPIKFDISTVAPYFQFYHKFSINLNFKFYYFSSVDRLRADLFDRKSTAVMMMIACIVLYVRFCRCERPYVVPFHFSELSLVNRELRRK